MEEVMLLYGLLDKHKHLTSHLLLFKYLLYQLFDILQQRLWTLKGREMTPDSCDLDHTMFAVVATHSTGIGESSIGK